MQPIFAMSFMFETIVKSGGAKLLLEKWDVDVANHRHQALLGLKHLFENYLVSWQNYISQYFLVDFIPFFITIFVIVVIHVASIQSLKLELPHHTFPFQVFVASKDVEFLVWRVCFYLPVEELKKMLSSESSNRIRQCVVDLVRLFRRADLISRQPILKKLCRQLIF